MVRDFLCESIEFLSLARIVLSGISTKPHVKKYILNEMSDGEVLYYLINLKKIEIPNDFISNSIFINESLFYMIKDIVNDFNKKYVKCRILENINDFVSPSLYYLSSSKKFIDSAKKFMILESFRAVDHRTDLLLEEIKNLRFIEQDILSEIDNIRREINPFKLLKNPEFYDKKILNRVNRLKNQLITIRKFRDYFTNNVIRGSETSLIKKEDVDFVAKALNIKRPSRIPYQLLLTLILYRIYKELDSKLKIMYNKCLDDCKNDDELIDCILKIKFGIYMKKLSFIKSNKLLCKNSDVPYKCLSFLDKYEVNNEDDVKKMTDMLSESAKKPWSSLPRGWTKKSVVKAFKTLSKDNKKKKITACAKKVEKRISDPWAFCASMARLVQKYKKSGRSKKK